MAMTVRKTIEDAIEEAQILESGRSVYDTDNMILTAMKLSGAPYSFVKTVFDHDATYATPVCEQLKEF